MQELFTIFLIFWLASSISRSRLEVAETNTFNVIDYGAVGNGQSDDSQAFLKGWRDVCGATKGIPTLTIPLGKTFLLRPVKFQGPCKSNNVHVQVLGNIVAPNTIAAWAGYEKDRWIQFSDVNGLTIDGSGKIDGRGSVWWSNASSLNNINVLKDNCLRPTALYIQKCNDFQLSGLKHLNSPKNHISINDCNSVDISNLHIIAPQDSPYTDGIDISHSTRVNIQSSLIETGDDCIAINGDSSYIDVTDITCGPGHGISVGRLRANGAYDRVEEVYVHNCRFKGTHNGARIMTWQGGSGYVRKISFEQISLMDVQNPIIIDQYYCNGGHNCKNQTSSVEVSDVTYRLVHGFSANEEAIKLSCSENIGCTNIVMDRVYITSSVPGKKTYGSCNNAHGTSRSVIPTVPCLSSPISFSQV